MILKTSFSLLSTCLLSLLLTLACTNQGTKTTETAASQSQEPADGALSNSETLTCEPFDVKALQTIADRVAWPVEPSDQKASYAIESGVDDGVWVEGKGYFKMTIAAAYQHFIDPQIIGPLHMTKNFKRTDFIQNDGCASFLLNVKMKYIVSIEFELTHNIHPIAIDGEDIGFVMNVKKTAGTSHIKEIKNTFIVKKFNDSYISIEAQSLNKATMNKPDEARQSITGLFERLEAMSGL